MTEREPLPGSVRVSRRRAVEFTRKPTSHGAGRPLPGLGSSDPTPPPGFDTLNDHKKIAIMRKAGEVLDIRNPFFRSHEGHTTATTVIDGKTVVNFGSYDYLGLNIERRTADAAHRAIDQYGISASASRVVAGERPVHRELEKAIAGHYHAEDALVFVSGHATNVATISALMREGDLVLHDSHIHNSVVTGSRLCGASRRSFKHNNMESLAELLAQNRGKYKNTLVVVEGLYSMGGDLAPLRELVELRSRFGFWLMVDEAHALGCVGRSGSGSFEHFGVDPGLVDIWMGTLSKTLASTGGYISGSAALIEILKSHASGFVYSVGLPPALAASAKTALDIMHDEPDRVARLHQNSAHFLERARNNGLDCAECAGFSIIPVMVGDSLLAAKLCERLLERGFNVMPIVFPAVPMQSARLRFFITSAHSRRQLSDAAAATQAELARLKSEEFAVNLPPELYEE